MNKSIELIKKGFESSSETTVSNSIENHRISL